ncbi:g4719 [Coccomyxa elongata]
MCSLQAHWDAAFEYAGQGNLEAAEDVLRALLDDEDLCEAYLDISKSCAMAGRRFAMSRLFMNEGHLMVEKNALEDAKGYYAFSMELSDANTEAMSGMAHVQLQLGNYRETVEICTRILKSLAKLQHKEALKRRGLAFYHLGMQREAWNDLTVCMGGAPRHIRKKLGVSYALDMFRLKLNPKVFGADLLAPEPSHTPAALAAATFHAEQEAAAQAVADVYGDTPKTAVLQEGKPKQTRRVHRFNIIVPPDATPADVLSAIMDVQEGVKTAGDQEFLSGRDAIAQANTKASGGKPACPPGMPLSGVDSDAGARKKKSRKKRKVTPQAGTSPDVQASAKAGKENKQQAEATRGGVPAKASAASGTAGHKPRSAASMACATKLLARLLDAVDEGNVKGNDLDEACDSDVDIVEVADALTQMSESPRRMTDEERRLEMDWADAETPKTAQQNSAARVDQMASSSIKALLGVTTSCSSECQEAPLAAAGEDHGIGLQGQLTAVASSAGQSSEGLAETGMETQTAAEDQEKLIPGVWELQVSLAPSQEDQDTPADATMENAASLYSAQPPNTVDLENMAVAVNATSATNNVDTPELEGVGQGSASPRADASACGAKTQTWKSTVTEKNTAAKIADKEDMLSSEGGTPLTAEALEKFNQHYRCMPTIFPEGRTYLTPEALEKFKAFLEDGSGSGSSEAGQHLAANRQEPSPGSDLTPMIAKTPLLTIPEQSEAEEEDEASEDGPGDNGKETLAAGSVAAHSHGQTECVDWWFSTQSTEWSASVASEEQLTGEDADMTPEASGWKLRYGGHGLPGRGHGRCKQ